jgi:hypothetical protein
LSDGTLHQNAHFSVAAAKKASTKKAAEEADGKADEAKAADVVDDPNNMHDGPAPTSPEDSEFVMVRSAASESQVET